MDIYKGEEHAPQYHFTCKHSVAAGWQRSLIMSQKYEMHMLLSVVINVGGGSKQWEVGCGL